MKHEIVQPLNVVPRWPAPGAHQGGADALPAALRIETRTEAAFSRSVQTDTLLLIHLITGSVAAEIYSGDKFYRGSARGQVTLILPPDSTCRLTISSGDEVIYLHVPVVDKNAVEPALVARDKILGSLIEIARSMNDARGLSQHLHQLILGQLERSFSSSSFHMPPSQRVRANAEQSEGNPLVTQAIEFMIENIDRSITLEDIGKAVGRSAGQLGRLFKNQLGRSPYGYLLTLRIERARALLATSSMPIAELALECGFANQEHLTRHFRQFCDTTPAAYRRQQGW